MGASTGECRSPKTSSRLLRRAAGSVTAEPCSYRGSTYALANRAEGCRAWYCPSSLVRLRRADCIAASRGSISCWETSTYQRGKNIFERFAAGILGVYLPRIEKVKWRSPLDCDFLSPDCLSSYLVF